MIEINAILFYTSLSSYLYWFECKNTKYIGYINSTINSVLIVLLEAYYTRTALKLYIGYLVYDTLSIINNKHEYKNGLYKQFIIHHLISFYLVYNSNNIDLTKDYLKLERSVPVMNISWFCNYYKIDNIVTTFLKIMTVILCTYYRVYHFGMVNYNNYINYTISYDLQIVSIYLYMLCLVWYKYILQIVNKSVIKYIYES